MTRPRVAIIVVTFNSEPLLDELIASLPAGAGDDIDWELVVADNDSRDGSVDRVRLLLPEALIVETGRNGGYAAGINAAVAAAGHRDAYLVLNPDVRLTPGCLPTLLRVLDDPEVGIAVPHLVDGDGVLIVSMRRAPSLLRAIGDMALGTVRAGRFDVLGEMITDPRRYQSPSRTEWAEGSTQLISRRAWSACGPWDESFFLYSEETDFDLRVGDHGLAIVYEPAATAVHLEGGSAQTPRLWSLLQVNRVRLYRRRHGPVATAAFWTALALREASRAALGRPVSRAALRALVSPRWWREPGPHLISG